MPIDSILNRIKSWARTLRRDVVALWIAARDSRTPWLAKAVAAGVAAYALSPIDLIPDFIPILGHLDDLVIVPAGIMLAAALIPHGLLAEFRAEAEKRIEEPRSMAGAWIVVLTWIAAAFLLMWWLWPEPAAGMGLPRHA